MQKLRKALVISVMSITVLSMCAFVAPQAKAAASAGDLIKMDGLSSVYYLAGDGKRYVFPNEATYFSWYSDFSGVVTIPQSELESYPLGKNITIRPGTKLVKITTDPKVYAVEPNGTLIHVPSETVASTLWGADWAKRVVDVPDAFFTNYTIGSGQVAATAYPAGSLVKWEGNPAVYFIDADGKARKIADEAAFLANRFKWGDIVTAPASVGMPTAGTDLTGADSALTDTSSGAGGQAGAGTGLTIALASDTPAAGNIPTGSPSEFLKINLTASNDGAVNLNGMILTAYDLGDATYIDNATFYKDGVKVGTSKNFTSDRTASFNFATPVEIAAGATVSLTVKATIGSSGTGNFAIGVAKAADVTTNGAAVSGSFPLRGNTKAIVSGSIIGTVSMGSDYDDLTATAKFGDDNVLLAEFNLTTANEAVLWESARFRNGGTNDNAIASNFKLLIDGTEVATANSFDDRYLDFDLNNFKIAKGDTVTVSVYGDIGIGQVGNTIDLYVYSASDFAFVGQDYGYGIQMTQGSGQLDAASTGIKVTLSSGQITIDMDKAATPSLDVRAGTDNLVIATLKIKSAAENITINSIKENGTNVFNIAQTSGAVQINEIENVELRDVDSGVIYDMTHASSSINSLYIALTMNEEITILKGQTKTFEIRVDLMGPNDTNAIDANDAFRVNLEDGAFSITGDESNASITDITPASVQGSIMTVKAASLTWTTGAMTNKSVVPGAVEIVYSAQLKAGASSDVTVTSFKLTTITDGSSVFIDNNISEFNAYLGSTLIKTLAGQITESDDSITFNNLGGKLIIPAGTTVDLTVKATFASSFSPSGDYFTLGVTDASADVAAKDIDNQNVDETVVKTTTPSRQVTLASTGTLKVELLVTDTKADADTFILAGGTTAKDRYMGELKFTTANEAIILKTLVLEQASTSQGDDIKAVKLFDKNGAVVASVDPSAAGHANFSDFNIELPADSVTSYFIGFEAKTMNADGDPLGTADFGDEAVFAIAGNTVLGNLGISNDKAVTAQGKDSGQDIACVPDADSNVEAGQYAASTVLSKKAMITGSVLNSVANAQSDSTLYAGPAKIIGKYKFVFDNGTNRTSGNEELKAQMKTLNLTISTSSASVANVKAYLETNSSVKTDAAAYTAGEYVIDITSLTSTTEYVDGEQTLVIVADITTDGTGDSVSTYIPDLGSDFTFNGNNGTGTDFTNARLDITEVIGATYSN